MTRKSFIWLVCGVAVLAGGYWLWAKGYQNVLGYGMLLLCPLMHLFMHGSHGHGAHTHAEAANSQGPAPGYSGDEANPQCH